MIKNLRPYITDYVSTRNFCGRGRRIRTLTGGFGDRCATINTIPLNILTTLIS